MDPVARIELLGTLRLTGSGGAVTRFRTRRVAALLGYLAYHRGRPVSRDALVELLWPGADPVVGRPRLRQALTSIRKHLEPPGVRERTAVVADHSRVELVAASVATDLADFDQALAKAARARAEERSRHLQAAVALYVGDLLPDHDEDWVAPERERVRARFLRAAHDLSAALLASGRAEAALEIALRAVAADPLAEEARRDVMRAHAASGQHAKALAELAGFEALLRSELGFAPGAETRELAREVERGARNPAIPARSRLPVRDDPTAEETAIATYLVLRLEEGDARRGEVTRIAGRHSGRAVLDDPGAVWHVFARPADALACVLALGGDLPGAALVTGSGGSARLARRASALLAAAHDGQVVCGEETAALLRHESGSAHLLHDHGLYRVEDEPERLHEVRVDGAALRPPRARRVGAGRLPPEGARFFGREEELARLEALLAVENGVTTITGPPGTGKTRLAIEAAARSRERVAPWFVPLGDATDARALPATLLRTVGAPAGAEEPLEQLARSFAAERAVFLLDGAEGVAKGLLPALRELRERLLRVSWLVTSRVRLGIEGETELALAPLATPAPGADLASVVRSPGVALFLDRARARLPDFQASVANASVLAEICRRLDGVPLALELAADWVAALGPSGIVERLDRRFALLVGRRRGGDERHRALETAIDASYEALEKDERRFFASLSVFRGGFTAAAAEAVSREPRALALLVGLVEHSLVASDASLPGRFRLLESLREYGHGKLEPRDARELARRHVEHYAALAARASVPLPGPEQAAMHERLAAEEDNLRVALERCGRRDLEALRLATALGTLHRARGSLSLARSLVETALDRGRARTGARAGALEVASGIVCQHGDYVAARALAQEGVELTRRLGDQAGHVRALTLLGSAAHAIAPRQARTIFARCARAAASLGGEEGARIRAVSLHNVACMDYIAGELEPARVAFDAAIAEFHAQGRGHYEAEALRMIGLVLLEQGRAEAARAPLEAALAVFRAASRKLAAATTVHVLAMLEERHGDPARARALWEEALAVFVETDSRPDRAFALASLAGLAEREGDPAKAEDLARDALELAGEATREAAAALGALGDVASRAGRLDEARERFREAISISARAGSRLGVVPDLERLAVLEERAGKRRLAARLLGSAAGLREKVGAPAPPRAAQRLAHLEATLRRALGPKPFEKATREGRALPWRKVLSVNDS